MQCNNINRASTTLGIKQGQHSMHKDVVSMTEGDLIGRNLLLLLPLELRQKIYRYLFRRRISILPIIFRDHPGKNFWYQWLAGPRHRVVGTGLPCYRTSGDVEALWTTWTTKATREELELLESGALEQEESMTFVSDDTSCSVAFRRWRLTNSTHKESGNVIFRSISRGPRGVEVHHTTHLFCPRLYGINLLGVSKQISAEASGVLYGENTFAFDTRSKVGIAATRGNRFYPDPQYERLELKQSNCSPEIHGLLRMLLGNGPNAFSFDRRDPLVRFLNKIGLVNASRLRRILIQGTFRVDQVASRIQSVYLPCDLVEILPIHTAILQKFCQNIQRLEIYQAKELYFQNGRFEMSDAERMDRMVRKVVEGLPHLKQLRLDSSEPLAWGNVVKWEKFVEDRYESIVEALQLKKLEEQRLTRAIAIEQKE